MSRKFFKALVIALWLASVLSFDSLSFDLQSVHRVPIVEAEECNGTGTTCPG